ncbi:THAP domain-containing protein 5 isoform X2 [Fundulus heteroclitus]|uniref:THAP domain-containing protein 5 isoform X2 n=1 Tax=Fundulus heteroclitus TaxID=8078 RepID=UPI00165AB993|nr:THAP domain-containing protein 5 isoform X2 [Fundulus heteroclitus]
MCAPRSNNIRFPLQDPARLQQWLRNMGRENWSPSRHQYVCHEHFAPSCFKVRWGIRYLDSDAVPTVFLEPEKRKADDPGDRKPKRLRGDTAPDPLEMQGEPQTLRLFEFSVDPTLQRDGGSLQTGVDSQASVEAAMAGGNGPPAVYQSVGDVVSGGGAEVVLMSESSAEGGRVELVNGIAAAILSRGGALVLNELVPPAAPPGLQDLSTQEFLQLHEGQQVVAYFETIPSVFPSGASTQFTFPPDTVLSSALSAEPISSTVPIVSKHAPPSLALSLERLDGEEAEEGEGVSDPDGTEQDDQQLGEHSYHKNSLSKEQLEAVVAELQKKVKVLQQRHRRHLEKLLGLENTVSQLRQSNTLNEERLQLLERAYLQSSASDAGETVAIIYEEDDAAYFYTPLNDAAAPLSLDNK